MLWFSRNQQRLQWDEIEAFIKALPADLAKAHAGLGMAKDRKGLGLRVPGSLLPEYQHLFFGAVEALEMALPVYQIGPFPRELSGTAVENLLVSSGWPAKAIRPTQGPKGTMWLIRATEATTQTTMCVGDEWVEVRPRSSSRGSSRGPAAGSHSLAPWARAPSPSEEMKQAGYLQWKKARQAGIHVAAEPPLGMPKQIPVEYDTARGAA